MPIKSLSKATKPHPVPSIPGVGTRFPTPRGQYKGTVTSGVGKSAKGDLRAQAYKRMRSIGSI